METLFTLVTPLQLAAALVIGLVAGTVKGLTGFAMPMILISGLSVFVAPDVALAGLILPTVVTNLWQALRQGLWAALGSVRRFGIYLAVGGVALVSSAQLVRVLPVDLLYLLIGAPITFFAVLQLAGWQPRFRPRAWVEALVGGFAGFIGGVSGVWGPPTVAYLAALDTPKAESMRVQGVIYGLGAFALLGAHVQSGVLRAETLPLSLVMVVPAVLGTAFGFLLHDRVDQATFRRLTLAVLLVAGLNLVRKGLW
jgi:uncharacterized membrane protein YfcA